MPTEGFVPIATAADLGVVRVDGATIDVATDGTLSVDASVTGAAPHLELTDGDNDLTDVSKITTSHMIVGGMPAAATLAPAIATAEAPGIVQPDGTTISVDGEGHIAATPHLELSDGTDDLTGVGKITVSNMTVGGTAPDATLAPKVASPTALGIVQTDGDTIDISPEGVITVADSVLNAAPNLELTDGITDLHTVSKITTAHMDLGGTADAATLAPTLATTVNPGIMQPDGTTLFVNEAGIENAITASETTLGIVQPDNSTIHISDAGVIRAAAQLELTDGTTDLTGVTKISTTGMTVGGPAAAATIAVNEASLTDLGISRPDGSTIDISVDGVLSVDASVLDAPPNLELTDGATDLTTVSKITTSGMVVGGTSAAATLAPDIATTLAAGVVIPDGETITVDSDGTIHGADQGVGVTPDGSTVYQATRIEFDECVVTGPAPHVKVKPQTGSASQLGVLQPDGTTITADGAGVISATATGLPSGAQGDILHHGVSVWGGLAAGDAGDVLTSDGTDVSYQPARVQVATAGADVGTRHTLDLTSDDGDIVLTPTDDGAGDTVHVDLALNPDLLAAIRGNGSTYLVPATVAAKAKSLWTGSGNSAPPASWYASAYDDSAWAQAVQSVPASGSYSQRIWPENPGLSLTEQALVRQHFTLPAGTITGASVEFSAQNMQAVYINGTLLTGSSGSTDTTIAVPLSTLVAGGANVIAVSVLAAGGGTTSGLAVAYVLSVTYNASGGGQTVIQVAESGTLVGTEPEINFIPGTGITLTVTDNPADARVDVAIAATGGGGGGGALTPIAEVVVTGSAAPTISFSGIPDSYRSLYAVLSVRSTYAGAAADSLYLQFNGDTGANYDDQQFYFNTTSAGGARHAAQTAAMLTSQAADAGSSADQFSSADLLIADYASTAKHKTFLSRLFGTYVVGEDYVWHSAGEWRSTAAINAILFAPGNGSFAVGSVITLYGLAAAGGGGGGGGIAVTDGTHAVDPATTLDFTAGAVVTDAGSGTADVAITQLSVGDGSTTVHPATALVFSGATILDAGGGQADVLIAQPILFAVELTGGAGTIDFTAIPATARHLRLEGIIRSDSTAGGTPVAWALRLNGISSGGYTWTEVLLLVGDSSAQIFSDTGQTALTLGGLEPSPVAAAGGLPTDSDAGHMIAFVIDIPYYGNYGAYKTVLAQIAGAGNAGQNTLSVRGQAQDASFTTAAISRVTLECASGNFAAASHVILYGVY